MSRAYYNEFDKGAAAWLRELIRLGAIAPGDVDERSIEDVHQSDLRGYTQCHFFAGIGVWSHALRKSGWSDDRPVWTGSCPCQPFSSAGKGAAFDDERHLWPAFHHLIKECHPAVVFGEQVASKDADPWIDLVQDDMEALGYAFGAVPFPAAGVGAPHIRDRLYWVGTGVGQADAYDARLEGRQRTAECAAELLARTGGVAGWMGITDRAGREQGRTSAEAAGHGCAAVATGDVCRLADNQAGGRREECANACGSDFGDISQGRAARLVHGGADCRPGPTNGFWRAADWLGCRDGKWRPVEPGTSPLVDGLAKGVVPSSRIGMAIDANATSEARVMRLRGYGNAINAQAAIEFISAYMESMP